MNGKSVVVKEHIIPGQNKGIVIPIDLAGSSLLGDNSTANAKVSLNIKILNCYDNLMYENACLCYTQKVLKDY